MYYQAGTALSYNYFKAILSRKQLVVCEQYRWLFDKTTTQLPIKQQEQQHSHKQSDTN